MLFFFFSRKLVSNTSVLLKIIKSKILIIGGLKKNVQSYISFIDGVTMEQCCYVTCRFI